MNDEERRYVSPRLQTHFILDWSTSVGERSKPSCRATKQRGSVSYHLLFVRSKAMQRLMKQWNIFNTRLNLRDA